MSRGWDRRDRDRAEECHAQCGCGVFDESGGICRAACKSAWNYDFRVSLALFKGVMTSLGNTSRERKAPKTLSQDSTFDSKEETWTSKIHTGRRRHKWSRL